MQRKGLAAVVALLVFGVSVVGMASPLISLGTSVTVGYLSVSMVRRRMNPSRMSRSLFRYEMFATTFDSAGTTCPLSSTVMPPVRLSVTPTASLGKLTLASCSRTK